MGGSANYSGDMYDRVIRTKIISGHVFDYTKKVEQTGIYEAHESLNVMPNGKPTTREARDSAAMPNVTPIIIGMDVTGSMGDNPAILQQKGKEIFGTIIRHGMVEDPQIAIAAYGDANCDLVPLQFGQFESDNKIDDELDNLYLERRGGGNGGETSTLLAYYAAYHTSIDSWEKRQRKGYLFIVGDERALDLTPSQVRKFVCDRQPQGNLDAVSVFRAAAEHWNIYVLIPMYDSKGRPTQAEHQKSYKQYSQLVGAQHVMKIHDASLAPAMIVALLATAEQTSTDLLTDLVVAGFTGKEVAAVHEAMGSSVVPADNANDSVTTVERMPDLGL